MIWKDILKVTTVAERIRGTMAWSGANRAHYSGSGRRILLLHRWMCDPKRADTWEQTSLMIVSPMNTPSRSPWLKTIQRVPLKESAWCRPHSLIKRCVTYPRDPLQLFKSRVLRTCNFPAPGCLGASEVREKHISSGGPLADHPAADDLEAIWEVVTHIAAQRTVRFLIIK